MAYCFITRLSKNGVICNIFFQIPFLICEQFLYILTWNISMYAVLINLEQVSIFIFLVNTPWNLWCFAITEYEFVRCCCSMAKNNVLELFTLHSVEPSLIIITHILKNGYTPSNYILSLPSRFTCIYFNYCIMEKHYRISFRNIPVKIKFLSMTYIIAQGTQSSTTI